MLKTAVRRTLTTLAALALVVLVAGALVVAWLSSGPVDAPALKPTVERILAAQVPGSRASVERVQIARFRDEGALGVRLSGVSVIDAKGSPVLRARLIEAALGSDSLLAFAGAPSRLVLRDFFVAASVSPQGRYALGYEAAGPPPPLDLRTIALSLTGETRRDRPLSYIRLIDLERGAVQFRQVGGPVAWKADIAKVRFRKHDGRLESETRLTVDDGVQTARVQSHVTGEVGLHALVANGAISDLSPARIFPAVSVTKPLSVLDAPIEGQARLEYALDEGVTAANVIGRAGAGRLKLGPVVQAFEGAELVTRYDPSAKQVLLERFHLTAERTRLDVTGRLWLVPEEDRRPARIEYRLASPHSLLTLAPSAPSQTLEDLSIAGAIIPERERFEIGDLRVLLAGAPVRLSAAVYRGRGDHASPGVKADIAVDGPLDISSLYAFWPEDVAPDARRFVVPRLHAARVLSSTVHVDIPPGQLHRRQLANDMLRVAFRYEGAGVRVDPRLPGVENAVGQGVIQGNRLDLTMSTGRLGKLAISDAVVTVPRFVPSGAVATIRSRAVGDLGDMLRLVDSPPLRMMASSKMSPDRFSGPADLVLEIKAPLRADATREDYEVTYEGRLTNLRIKDVTLGEDLKHGQMKTRGNLDYVEADGPAKVGPFAGNIAFRMPLKGKDSGRKFIELDGKISLLGAAGAPFKADVNTRYGIGAAQVRSRVFNGRAEWRKGDRMHASGWGDPVAWKQAGIPAGPGFPARIPLRMAMTANDGRWSGTIEADAYSGRLSYAGGAGRTVRYEGEITPAEARRIGVGELPMFERAQSVVLDLRMGEEAGRASYAIGGLDGRFGWTVRPAGGFDYRFDTTMDPADFAAIGIPLTIDRPLPIEASGSAVSGAIRGLTKAAGADIDFNLTPIQAGRRTITFSGSAPEATFERLGLDVDELMDGRIDFDGRLVRHADGLTNGRLAADLEHAALRVPGSDWSKPLGQKARAYLDLHLSPDGAARLERIVAEGPGLEVGGTGAVAPGRASVTLTTARLAGFFDGALRASSAADGLSAVVDGAYLDFRPILKAAQKAADGGAIGGSGAPLRVRLDAELDRVRVTDTGYVRDVKVVGGWGALAQRAVDLSATSEQGSDVRIKVYPDKGATALSLYVADLGDIARSLGAYDNLRGGVTTGTGRIVEGGYDFSFEIRDMTILRVPGAAQLVATDGAIAFDRVVAPMRIRGGSVILEDVVATGQSVGLTARGVMDTKTRTLDVVGVVTPAYSLNRPLGGLLGAPEGEGLFGVTYSATGPFDDPQIDINPLSAIAPGFLRRMFEGPTPTPDDLDEAY